ncbi:hypothetical protein GY15_24060 [Delftia sp. 670]|nr:hypothetical protein GY15_24060 [Delftia sp. 670]
MAAHAVHAAAQTSFCSGLPGASRLLRSTIRAAPSAFRCSACSGRPVPACTSKPRRDSRATAMLPTPPLAPVTSTGPLEGVMPCACSAITHSMAV